MHFSHQPDLHGSSKSNLEHAADAEGVHSPKCGAIYPKDKKRHFSEVSVYSRKQRGVIIKSQEMTQDMDNHDMKAGQRQEDALRISQETVFSRYQPNAPITVSASQKTHSDCGAASLPTSPIGGVIKATSSSISSGKEDILNSFSGEDVNFSFRTADASTDELFVEHCLIQRAALQNVGSVCKSGGSRCMHLNNHNGRDGTLKDREVAYQQSQNVGSVCKSGGSHCMHLNNHNGRDEALKDREVASLSLICSKRDVASSQLVIKEVNDFGSSTISLGKADTIPSRKKLLVLDLNGLLVDANTFYGHAHRSEKRLGMKAVYKRPYCDDFLKFCFEKFNVGVWSSRRKNNVDDLVDYLMKDFKHRLLFSWDQSKCTETGHGTIGNHRKPLVLKELKKLWSKEDPDLPWKIGDYSPSNTLLVDDSPYKAICNPHYTAIFPYPFQVGNKNDNSLGPEGDIHVYLDGIAVADDVQKYVEAHPFGQKAITESNPSWKFYSQIIEKAKKSKSYGDT